MTCTVWYTALSSHHNKDRRQIGTTYNWHIAWYHASLLLFHMYGTSPRSPPFPSCFTLVAGATQRLKIRVVVCPPQILRDDVVDGSGEGVAPCSEARLA